MPTVIITGGTGFTGRHLAQMLAHKGFRVIIFSRRISARASENIQFARWDIEKGIIDEAALSAADYIIHLAGAAVMEKTWKKSYKKQIIDSRVKSSELLVDALHKIPNKVKAIISASATGWYPASSENDTGKGFMETNEPADTFLAQVCRQWEASIKPVTALNKRLCIVRIGVVLGKNGGALKEFLKPLKFRMCAYMGNGRQTQSWIGLNDLCRIFLFLMENQQAEGVFNAVAPGPVTNKTLVKKLAKKLLKRFYLTLPVPAFVLNLFLGERSIEILRSTNVSSEKIEQAGFKFETPDLESFLETL